MNDDTASGLLTTGQFASAPGGEGGGEQQAPKQKELFQHLPEQRSPAAEAAGDK